MNFTPVCRFPVSGILAKMAIFTLVDDELAAEIGIFSNKQKPYVLHLSPKLLYLST